MRIVRLESRAIAGLQVKNAMAPEYAR